MVDVGRGWQAPERHPDLAPGELHVWLADLTAADFGDDALAALSAHERSRATRFVRLADRQRYVAAHVMLRCVLAAYLGGEPAALEFRARTGGKPELAGAGPRFNLSHAGPWALVAVAGEREVGADIETAARPVSWRELAREVLTEEEAAWLETLEESRRRQAFLQLWVAKEAVVKADGAGLRIKTGTLAVGPLVSRGDAESEVCVQVGARQFWVRPLQVPGAAVAAVACEGGPVAVRLFRYW